MPFRYQRRARRVRALGRFRGKQRKTADAIPVVSPSARTSQQPQGKTLLKRRQLQAAGWRLMGVPYWEWDACRRDRAEQCALLSARLDEAVPGWQSGREY